METRILRVVSQDKCTMVPSKKQESGQLAKCYIRLKELGSDYEDEFVVTMFGNLAQCRFAENSLVAVNMRFAVHEVNGAQYQEIVANDIVNLK